MSNTTAKEIEQLRGRESGADAYLTKPCDAAKLFETIVRFFCAHRKEGYMLPEQAEKSIYTQRENQSPVTLYQNAPSAQIKGLAQSQGRKTLRESGVELVFRGMTTVEEVFRNTVE